MDKELRFFDYPQATIRRRKLIREIRRMQLDGDDRIGSSVDPIHPEVVRMIAALEQEMARVEAKA